MNYQSPEYQIQNLPSNSNFANSLMEMLAQRQKQQAQPSVWDSVLPMAGRVIGTAVGGPMGGQVGQAIGGIGAQYL
jgi:hypothetical protein